MRIAKVITFSTATALALAIATAPALARLSEAQRLQRAAQTLRDLSEAPDKGIPDDLMQKAECIGVFPGVAKGAFVLGGEGGRGVFTCRQSDSTMGAPAFFTLGGGSVGWQAGGQSTDLVFLVMNPQGTSHLLKSRVTIGANASAAAGPVGRRAVAATDGQLHAQILSWSRSRGIFVGASLDGTVLKPDKKANARYYGSSTSAQNILFGHAVSAPDNARSFLSTANRLARR